MNLLAVAFVVGTYLYASIPLVYLLGRRRGMDLSRVRSGNVGVTNLWQTVGPVEALTGGVFDATKGALPAYLALHLGLGEGVAALAAVVGMIGQCWPLFLLIPGGRGISTFGGTALVLLPRELVLAWVPMIVGWAMRQRSVRRRKPQDDGEDPLRRVEAMSRSVPLGMALGFGLLPILASLFGEPQERVVLVAACFVVMMVRRLTAGLRADWATAESRGEVIVNRLLYDRSHR